MVRNASASLDPAAVTRCLAHASVILYVLAVRDGRLVPAWVSDNIRRILGYRPEDVLGDADWWPEHLHPDDRAQTLARMPTLFKRGEIVHNYRFLKKDGTVVWVTDELRVCRRRRGVPTRIVGCWTEITERRRTTHELTLFHTLIDRLADAIFIVDAETGRFVDFNHQACTSLGYTVEELMGLHVHDIDAMVPDESAFRAHVAEIRARRTIRVDGLMVRKDGTRFPVEVNAAMVELPEGEFLVALARDVTERKALESQNERLGRIIENSSTEFYLVDGETLRFRHANRGALRNLGYSLDELHELTICDVAANLTADEFRRLVAPLEYGMHERVEFESVHRRKDGSLYDAAVTVQNVPTEARRAFVVEVRDITESKKVEEELRHVHRMEAVGRLTGGIAHDFNNLLTVILGNLQLIKRRAGGDERLLRQVATAEKAARRGAEMTSRLLAFARRQALDPRPTDINEVLRDIDEMLRRTIGENIELRMALAEGLWSAEIDRSQLETAILNLATNARDAMPNGGRLTIETANAYLDRRYAASEREVTPGEYVMVSVSDTGTGMSEETLSHIFEPFYTTKEPGRGTGLGLAMVHGFVKQSGGHIKVYSERGHGTTVRLYLPRSKHGPERDGGGGEGTEALPRGDETVLVVEDDADVREIAKSILEGLGYRVLIAENGPSALTVLDANPSIALLFTDMIMPGGMDGAELARIARSRRPGLKVLFATGYSATNLAPGRRGVEGIDLVPKPFDEATVARKVRQVLDGG